MENHSNCFAEGSDLRQIDTVVSRLLGPDAFLGLANVCERWIYSSCLCFGLTCEEHLPRAFATVDVTSTRFISRWLSAPGLLGRASTQDGLRALRPALSRGRARVEAAH
jgi:hypothetical protein